MRPRRHPLIPSTDAEIETAAKACAGVDRAFRRYEEIKREVERGERKSVIELLPRSSLLRTQIEAALREAA